MFVNAHVFHDYRSVIQIMRIDSIEEKYEKSGRRFIKGLLLSGSRLLEKLSTCFPGKNTKFIKMLYWIKLICQ